MNILKAGLNALVLYCGKMCLKAKKNSGRLPETDTDTQFRYDVLWITVVEFTVAYWRHQGQIQDSSVLYFPGF